MPIQTSTTETNRNGRRANNEPESSGTDNRHGEPPTVSGRTAGDNGKMRSGHIPGRVAIVGAGPGDPELITLKAVRLLRSADVVLYDRLCNPDLLHFTRPGTRKICVGKQCGKPSISQADINRLLISHARNGGMVVRLKGGDPFIFGRGGEECMELAQHGIPFEVVPGISSISAVPAYAGIPLTMRNQATGFTVISGHLHDGSDSYDWRALAGISTLVILMGLKNLHRIIEELIRNGKPADTPIALIRWGTTVEQQVITGTLADIPAKTGGVTSPVTIVIGEVVQHTRELAWFQPERAHTRTVRQLS
ncbi:uroporphyrinogen-III C-methyltransferase [Balneolales bacterium ANBcel1]|nr:uroporphyrinogen-III C-methyltransferase [Balneolales bacterium ANBcel1]